MLINFLYLGIVKGTLKTATNDPDDFVEVTLDTQEDIEDDIEDVLVRELESVSGFYGHLVTLDTTTNLDLYTAFLKLPSFTMTSVSPKPKPKVLQGEVQT